MFIEIERITTTTYIKDINLIDTNMMGPRHYHNTSIFNKIICFYQPTSYEILSPLLSL